jgi:hypothetical protein
MIFAEPAVGDVASRATNTCGPHARKGNQAPKSFFRLVPFMAIIAMTKEEPWLASMWQNLRID